MNISRLWDEAQWDAEAQKDQFAIDVLTGLCSSPKQLSSKYFYDDHGSELFQKITQHEDYYPTRTEFQLLDKVKQPLAMHVEGVEVDIVELGAGDGHKSQLILQGFLEKGKKVNFYPIDISEKAMELLSEQIDPHPRLQIHPVVGEYFDGLKFVRKQSKNPIFLLFLGSNIGNFDRTQNQGFLRRLWKHLDHNDQVLIGFDMKKDVAVLNRAYNDSAGYTRSFNKNLLARINRELGANFDLDAFQHFGSYNPILGAMESYLLSTSAQKVYIKDLERSFYFAEYEPLHLEYSFKFLKSDIDFLSKQTGFEVIEHFSDSKGYFVDSLWQVQKS